MPVIILTYNNTLWLVIKRPKDCTLGIVATYVRGTGCTQHPLMNVCTSSFIVFFFSSILPLYLDDFFIYFFLFFAVCLLFSVFVVVVLFIVLLFSVKHLYASLTHFAKWNRILLVGSKVKKEEAATILHQF